MPLIFITGIPGSGKSTVRSELLKRGFEAHDVDEDGLKQWRDKKTKVFKSNLHLSWSAASKDFKETHDLDVVPEKIKAIADSADAKPVFLCGSTGNEKELWNYFDKVFCLSIDSQTLHERIKHRKNNTFGKNKEEFQNILRWHKGSDEAYTKFGATLIDATQPVEKIVNEILEHSHAA
jgi:thymidylate kinase